MRFHLSSFAVLTLVVSALVATPAPVAGQGALPTPESVLGFEVGADFRLATYEQSVEYFQALAAASDRVRLERVGRSSFGRDWYVALISSPENLANAERYREISRRLAHPAGLTDEEARALSREGKAIVHIDGGLHATETAHAQHTIQLAYDLVSGVGEPEIDAVLDEVILLLWPSVNPDGQTMVADWYAGNVGTPFEISPMPRLYQKYVGHDNNRDGYMINMKESRVVTRVDRHWEPQILYNHHQTAPSPATIWIPPFAEPVSPYVHPLMWRTVNLMGMSMATALEERGLRGATHQGTGFDNWYPGFMDHANNFHNVAAFLTETGQHPYATPRFYTLRDFPPRARDLRPGSMYASPWQGGWWRLRDSVEYMLVASMSVLDFAAKYKDDVLYNRYQAGRDVLTTHREDPPYAYFIPRQQRDPTAAVELLRRLAFNGIEVRTLDREITYERQTYPAGTWVIPMDQEFANFARQLFAIQEYPDLRQYPEGPPDQPYDVAGWTLQYQMDVRVIEGRTPLDSDLRSALTPLAGEPQPWDTGAGSEFDSPMDVGFDSHPVATAIVPPPGSTTGSGPALALSAAANNTFKALNHAWEAGARVRFEPGEPGADDRPGSSGRYRIEGLDGAIVGELVESLHLRGERVANGVGVAVERPRVGVYHPWQASMDEGWTRWILDAWDFEYTELHNADVRAGALGDRYDVILFADMSPRTILEGYPEGSVPARYAGGIGPEGAREIERFVREGGTVVALNGSIDFVVEQLRLPVRDVTAELERSEFFVSGSILQVEVDPAHPVMAGMPADAKLFVDRSPVMTVEEGFRGRAFARYPEAGSPLLSGYLLGEQHLNGFAAGLEAEHGEGRAILLGFRPQWRGQPFGTFRVLFNSILYSDDLAAATPEGEGFWSAPEPEPEESEEQ